MKYTKVLTVECNATKTSKFYEPIEINDTPITDDFDAWRAIDAAEQQMLLALSLSNKYKYIQESQCSACKDIFSNLKTLISNYLEKGAGVWK